MRDLINAAQEEPDPNFSPEEGVYYPITVERVSVKDDNGVYSYGVMVKVDDGHDDAGQTWWNNINFRAGENSTYGNTISLHNLIALGISADTIADEEGSVVSAMLEGVSATVAVAYRPNKSNPANPYKNASFAAAKEAVLDDGTDEFGEEATSY